MMQFIYINYSKSRAQAGLAAIEFALILPVLLILGFSVFDFGRVLFQYDMLTKSTRDATRYLASVVRPPKTSPPSDAYIIYEITSEKSAKNLALCGSTNACGDKTLVNGLTASNILIDYPANTGGITYVRISVSNYSTNFLTTALGVSKTFVIPISVTMRQIQQ